MLKGDGYETPENFSLNATFKLDVELWEIGTQDERLTQVELLEMGLSQHEGEITDRYVGVSFTALRVSGTGAAFRWLLNLPTVRIVDRPPVIDEHMEALLDTTISEIGEPATPSEDAPSIAVLDSGVNDLHPRHVFVFVSGWDSTNAVFICRIFSFQRRRAQGPEGP